MAGTTSLLGLCPFFSKVGNVPLLCDTGSLHCALKGADWVKGEGSGANKSVWVIAVRRPHSRQGGQLDLSRGLSLCLPRG